MDSLDILADPHHTVESQAEFYINKEERNEGMINQEIKC
jgi:hypothetical protein